MKSVPLLPNLLHFTAITVVDRVTDAFEVVNAVGSENVEFFNPKHFVALEEVPPFVTGESGAWGRLHVGTKHFLLRDYAGVLSRLQDVFPNMLALVNFRADLGTGTVWHVNPDAIIHVSDSPGYRRYELIKPVVLRVKVKQRAAGGQRSR